MMVVVAILGTLVLQSVATFHLAQQRTTSRAAEATLRNALESARVLFVDEGAYSPDPVVMADVEPGIPWTDQALSNGGDRHVLVATADGDQTLLLARRAGDRCFFLRDAGGGTTFAVTAESPGVPCSTPAPADFSDSWPS
jgi:type IV pilus assembly protein PilA